MSGVEGYAASPLVRHAVCIGGYIVLMALIDGTIALTQLGGKTGARWLAIHAVANLIVSILALPDFVVSIVDPIAACVGEPGLDYSLHPTYMIAALHMYHMIPGLFPNVTADDYFHHIVFGGIICSIGIAVESGPVQNFVAFFICGLPGGLDYIMLVLVKLGRLKREDEKVWNARINVWVRSPGLLASAFSIYAAALYGDARSACHSQPTVAFVTALIIVVNAQYYLQVVVGNTFRKVDSYNS